jgi:hypothetical protein
VALSVSKYSAWYSMVRRRLENSGSASLFRRLSHGGLLLRVIGWSPNLAITTTLQAGRASQKPVPLDSRLEALHAMAANTPVIEPPMIGCSLAQLCVGKNHTGGNEPPAGLRWIRIHRRSRFRSEKPRAMSLAFCGHPKHLLLVLLCSYSSAVISRMLA